jgi:hypothetical protein
VRLAPFPFHETAFFQPIHKFDGAVMTYIEPLSQIAYRWFYSIG